MEEVRRIGMMRTVDDEPVEATGGWHAALAGAVLGAGLAAWWFSADAVPTRAPTLATSVQPSPWAEQARSTTSSTVRQAATPPAAAHAPAPTVAAGPAPVQYVGQWFNAGRQAVVLSHHGRSVVVQVPGMVDGRFEVVSANDRELVLRDRGLGTTQRIAFGVTSAAAAVGIAEAAPSDEAIEEAATAPVRPAKLPPLSQRTSDEVEPEN